MNLTRQEIREIVVEDLKLINVFPEIPDEYLTFLEFFTRDEVFNISPEEVDKFIKWFFKEVVKINASLATIVFLGLPASTVEGLTEKVESGQAFLDFIKKYTGAVEMSDEETAEFIQTQTYLSEKELGMFLQLQKTSLFSRTGTHQMKVQIDEKTKKVTFVVEKDN